MSKILDFFKENAEEIVKSIPTPLYSPELNGKSGDFNKWAIEELSSLKYNFGATRTPFPGQVEYVINPLTSLYTQTNTRASIIVGKMGTGKTTMSNSIAILLYLREYAPKGKGFKTGMFVSGSKHMKKMKREIEAIAGSLVEVYSVVSKPRKTVEHEITIEEAILMNRKPGKIRYFLISKDTGKNQFKLKPMKPGQKCPDCGSELRSSQGKRTEAWKCHECNAKTYQTISGKESFASKIKRMKRNKHDKFFDFFIIDEVHEFANKDSLQSIYYKAIVNASYRVTVMTGTLSNGYASSIFHILYPLFAKHFKKYGGFTYEKVASFVNLFGSKKETSEVKVINDIVTGKPKTKIQELPQISDRIISFLAPYTVWFDIRDLNVEMPEFKEFERIVPLDPEISMAFNEWKDEISEIAEKTNRSLNLYQFNTSFHYRINNPTKKYSFKFEEEEVLVSHNGIVGKEFKDEVESFFRPLDSEHLFNKEKSLVEECKSELSEGRRILIYGVYNNSTNVYDRLKEVLEREGILSEIMPSSLKSEDIEEWLRSPDREDVVLVPQKRVATGLDLVEFHTVMFYEIDKELKTVSQAKVRPWRPVGQDKEVRAFYFAYEGKQADALKAMAQKMRAAAVVDGEVIDNNTIAAIYDYNPELTAAIAEISAKIENINSSSLKRSHSELEEKYISLLKHYDELLEKNGGPIFKELYQKNDSLKPKKIKDGKIKASDNSVSVNLLTQPLSILSKKNSGEFTIKVKNKKSFDTIEGGNILIKDLSEINTIYPLDIVKNLDLSNMDIILGEVANNIEEAAYELQAVENGQLQWVF